MVGMAVGKKGEREPTNKPKQEAENGCHELDHRKICQNRG